MPLTTLHLIGLKPTISVEKFLQALRQELGSRIIVASRPRHVVISATSIDPQTLSSEQWHLMVLLQSPRPDLSWELRNAIRLEYAIAIGVPSRLLSTYPERNAILRRDAAKVPLTGSLDNLRAKETSQNLEVSPTLLAFMDDLSREYDGPVTMLNLLHFHPDSKSKYYQYGQEFKPVAGKRGGDAKLVGNVVPPGSNATTLSTGEVMSAKPWDEISIVHYPSIKHFCDMLASDEYQAINEKHRLTALKDTFLLCTTEFDLNAPGPSHKL